MTAKQRYTQAMDWLYIACIGVSGLALVAITLMIPSGVFMRYVMNNPLSWPEPASVMLMVMFSFIGGAAVVPRQRARRGGGADRTRSVRRCRRRMSMASTSAWRRSALFMLYYGIQLCIVTQHSTMAEFPDLSQAVVYLPIPIAGLLTLLFLFERVWIGEPPKTSLMYRRPGGGARASHGRLVLLGTFRCCARCRCPIAYALGLAAITAALWIDIPLEAVMLKISDGTDDFALLAIPFFVLAGGIMAEGGMALRLVNLARVFVGFIRGGLALVNILASTLFGCDLRLVGGRHRVDRLGDDSADGQGGLSRGCSRPTSPSAARCRRC